jgi:hypothetical protein
MICDRICPTPPREGRLGDTFQELPVAFYTPSRFGPGFLPGLLAMDALFIPLADSFGASVDQIKVRPVSLVVLPAHHKLTLLPASSSFAAYNMPTYLIPPREYICAGPFA